MVVALAAVAGGVAATWAIDVYNSAPPLSSLQAGPEGPLLGDLRRRRQPDRLHPLQQHPPAGLDRRFRRPQGRDGRDRGPRLLRPRRRRLGRRSAAPPEEHPGRGQAVEGASTITQQLVRNLYIQHPEQTIKRKLIEAHLAYEEEEAHSKTWILTAYLNTAPYGTVEGQTAVGAEAAAQTYFGKPAKDLSLTEAALIAGLPQAPSEYNPFLDPRAAKERRNEVLDAMEEEGYITSSEYREARASGLGLNPGDKYKVIRDPFLFDLVQQELIDKYGINTVRNGGLKAYTTIDPELQERAEEAVESCSVCYPEGGPAAGLASVNPDNGEIVALASTEGYATENQFNYAWQAHRQPGSSFKTFVLTTAIKQGIDPDTTYYDGTSPMTLELPGGGTWTVNNAEPGGGVMSLAEATGHSVNVIFAQLDLDVGPENVTETAHEMGIEAPLESVPAEAIGGLAIGVTPLEMADAYATLANGGIHHEPTAIGRVEFPDGDVDEADNDSGDRVLTEGQAYEVTQDPRGRDHRGHRRRLHLHGLRARRRARRAPRRASPTPGSPATRRSTRPRSGSATRSRAKRPASEARPPARSGARSCPAVNGDCPEFEVPASLPELDGLNSEHTRSSSEAAPRDRTERRSGRRSEEEEEGRRRRKKAATKAAATGTGAEPAPAPTPARPHAARGPAALGVGGGVAAPTGA